jgi:hypothetical protein
MAKDSETKLRIIRNKVVNNVFLTRHKIYNINSDRKLKL